MTVHPLTNKSNSTETDHTQQSEGATSPHMGRRPRPPHMLSFSSLTNRRRASHGLTDETDQSARPERELSSELESGEEVRVAVVIRMPREAEDRNEDDQSADDQSEDEVGWENGMELGVWEGFVGSRDLSDGPRLVSSRKAWSSGEVVGD